MEVVVKSFVLAVFMCGMIWAQSEPTVDDAFAALPPELQGKVDKKQVEEIKNKSLQMFKEKCEKNGGSDAFHNAEKAMTDFTNCVKSLVDVNLLQKEIEDAKPHGQVDEVFKKYCAKTPQFKDCFRSALEAVKPCMTVDERHNLNTVHNVSEQLAEFVCYKEGDRIALFIAEGGPECFQDKQEQIQACVNSTFGADYHLDTNNFTADSFTIPTISFGEKECGQLTTLEKCVVAVLDKCEQPTSANIVESLFKFVRQATPCKSFGPSTKEKSSPGSAHGLIVTSATVIIAAIVSLLV